MNATPHLFEAFLKCPTKCWLRAANETPAGNAYAQWSAERSDLCRAEGIKRIVAEQLEGAVALAAENLKTAAWRLAVDVPAGAANIETRIAAVERLPSAGRGKPAQFVPIRFAWPNKLGRHEKLLLAFDALALSETLGRDIPAGKIIHGDDHAVFKVKLPTLMNEVRKLVARAATLLSHASPPDLVLNRHCAECEFQARCRQKAVEKDDLSLLAGMTEKERKKFHSKGIFTVTQLSYTFRPRRRPKRMRDKREKYHHALKALAIREKKIHIVGSPELKIDGTPVYLDVEGLPDRDFYYLIGVRIGNGDTAVQHSLWADTVEDERRIWNEFLALIATIEKPVLIHYGSYETTFLKHMRARHGETPDGLPVAKTTPTPVNLLSVMFSHIYFPVYSNGLKDVTRTLGFKWSTTNPSGTQAISWRQDWEQSADAEKRQQLIAYNSEDCAACELVAGAVSQCCSSGSQVKSKDGTGLEITSTESIGSRETMWPKFSSQIEGFEAINKAGRWDYQRDRIYIRTEKKLKRVARTLNSNLRGTARINEEITRERPRICPHCGRKSTKSAYAATRTLYDLRFSRFGVRRRAVKYHFRSSYCPSCHVCFGKPEEFWQGMKYGRNVVALLVFKTIDLCMQQRAVTQDLNRLFQLGMAYRQVQRIKAKAAGFYEETRGTILAEMIKGNLIHADETQIALHGKTAYVWTFATFREVVYFYSDSREGDLPQKLLNGFKGVLVSDFYAAYDAIPCAHQKCLIHLMRDLNDAVLDRPYDEEVKGIVIGFAGLLKSIVETVDRRGLKCHFLRKHVLDVARFYRQLSRTTCQSDAASKCKERFEKNRDKLFMFLNHDGVPWNNNNAEHAIKAFARLRRAIDGLSTPQGIEDYLVLLSVCQTCKYMGVDFLDFLRSGEKDVHAFVESRRRRRSVNPKPPAAIDPPGAPPRTADRDTPGP